MAEWRCKLTAGLTLGGEQERDLKDRLTFEKRQKESIPASLDSSPQARAAHGN